MPLDMTKTGRSVRVVPASLLTCRVNLTTVAVRVHLRVRVEQSRLGREDDSSDSLVKLIDAHSLVRDQVPSRSSIAVLDDVVHLVLDAVVRASNRNVEPVAVGRGESRQVRGVRGSIPHALVTSSNVRTGSDVTLLGNVSGHCGGISERVTVTVFPLGERNVEELVLGLTRTSRMNVVNDVNQRTIVRIDLTAQTRVEIHRVR